MNKKMREIWQKMQGKLAESKQFIAAGEKDKFSACMDEYDELVKDFNIEKRLYAAEKAEVPDGLNEDADEAGDPEAKSKRDADIKAFAGYVRAMVNKASTPQNITVGNNGALIPESIASMIIKQVKQICPIYAKATMFHSKGKLKVPVYGDKEDADGNKHNISVAFAAEFTELTADAGAFVSVDLEGFLVGALALIGISVINNTDIDVVNFITSEMSTRIAWFIESILLNGAAGYNAGALATTNNLNGGSVDKITADNLIDLQGNVPPQHQANACWTMHPDTFKYVRKMKYGDGTYMLQPDMTLEFPYRLLGKPVNPSENMPKMGNGTKPVLYGDYSGLGVNMPEDISIQVLVEKYATQHAIGVVGWFEIDSDIIDPNKLATLTMSV